MLYYSTVHSVPDVLKEEIEEMNKDLTKQR